MAYSPDTSSTDVLKPAASSFSSSRSRYSSYYDTGINAPHCITPPLPVSVIVSLTATLIPIDDTPPASRDACLTVFLPVGTVGVQGDQRTYGYLVVLREITSEDGMTADW
ncbi:hypothetical protein KSP39_PZI017969 [Platanthera zijinensis]|uniref:GMP synthase C-terminal domain-containing protein n=1 Tax=Platanthera zijinensis TaxID=2320716 RepID=A0AAP0B5T1_9ASPA